MITINKTIFIYPYELQQNLNDILIKKCNEQVLYKSDKEYGYIKSISKINKIKENRICQSTGNILFNIDLLCEVLKPEVGLILNDCTIINILDNCILCKKDCLNIAIIKEGLKNIEILDHNKFLYYDEEFNIDDKIDLEIIQYLYTNGIYHCICKVS